MLSREKLGEQDAWSFKDDPYFIELSYLLETRWDFSWLSSYELIMHMHREWWLKVA